MAETKVIRQKKEDKYESDRRVVLQKVLNILQLSKNKDIIFMESITDNQKKQILELDKDVKKYFNYVRWSYFGATKPDDAYLSLAKSIMKDLGLNCSHFIIKNKVKNKIEHGLKIYFD